MSNKSDLKEFIESFNKSNKDNLRISFGSPFGKNKYLFINHKDKILKPLRLNQTKDYSIKLFFKTYIEAYRALQFLELYLTVKDHYGDFKKWVFK